MFLRHIKNNIYKINVRNFRYNVTLRKKNEADSDDKKDLSSSIATKFQVFKNENVGIILDIEEERARRLKRLEEGYVPEQEHEIIPAAYADLNLERGTSGVFDIEDLVELLRRENAIDLCVIKVPQQFAYVDYMVIITGTTFRHMLGMASFVRKLYKIKRLSSDSIPKIEGKECSNWMAMDLGNIALHIFSSSARQYYNLESLWIFGSEYEKKVGRNNEAVVEEYKQFFTTSVHTDKTEELAGEEEAKAENKLEIKNLKKL